MDPSPVTLEERRLARLSTEAHQALIHFMNETAHPYTAEQHAECEALGRAAASARESYLKWRRAVFGRTAFGSAACEGRTLCPSACAGT